MILFCQVVFVVLLIYSLRIFAGSFCKQPSRRANRAFEQSVMKKASVAEKIGSALIEPLARLVEPFIRMPEARESKLKSDLTRAGIKESPKMYYARAAVFTALLIPVPMMLYLLGMTVFVFLSALLIAAVFLRLISGYKEILKKKRAAIERVIPGFIRAILYKLNDGKDGIVKANLISIFESYLKVTNPIFVYDISVLIMEMKSKSPEAALRSFNNRLGIPEVHFLCNALIGITRGEQQSDVLASLAREMDIKTKEFIRRELEKRPQKVIVACIPLVIVAFLAIGYVLISAVMVICCFQAGARAPNMYYAICAYSGAMMLGVRLFINTASSTGSYVPFFVPGFTKIGLPIMGMPKHNLNSATVISTARGFHKIKWRQ